MLLWHLLLCFHVLLNLHIVQSSQSLIIDPSSIFVDDNLYQLCWNQTGPNSLQNLIGIHQNSKKTFVVFQDSVSRRFCIEHRNRNDHFNILLPLTNSSRENILNLTIKFSSTLGPPLGVVRFKAVARGVHFQLKNEFNGISRHERVSCDIILLYRSHKSEKVIQIKLSSLDKSSKTFVPVKDGLNFDVYFTCTMPNVLDVSSAIVHRGLGFFPKDKVEDLQPFIFMPLRQFILVLWKLPLILPENCNIAIYKVVNESRVNCSKLFRILSNNMSPTDIIAENCDKNVSIEDLGHIRKNEDGHFLVILDMIDPLDLYCTYRLSIFWKNQFKEIGENYLTFTPLPNNNSGSINRKLLNFDKHSFEDLSKAAPSIYQQVLSTFPINPIMEEDGRLSQNLINKEITILPTFTFLRNFDLRYAFVTSRNELIKRCEKIYECSAGSYPFFYSLFIEESNSEDVVLEIIQLPKNPENRVIEMRHLSISSNDYNSTFRISWNILNHQDSIIPALYIIEIRTAKYDLCQAVYMIKCRTCNQNYLKISENYVSKNTNWKSVLHRTIIDIYDTVDDYISFDTEPMPSSINFHAVVYSVRFSTIIKHGVSNSISISAPFGAKEVIFTVGLILGLVIVVFLIIVSYRHLRSVQKKHKKGNQKKIKFLDDQVYESD